MSRPGFNMRGALMCWHRKAMCLAFISLFTYSAFAQEASVPVKVVASFSILGDIVKNVGGDKIDLSVLVGPDSDAHTFEPTPEENIILSQASIVFENGLHFEHWMNDLYESSGSKAKRVVVTEGVEPISSAAHEDIDEQGSLEDIDPHVWHDISNVMVMTERVRDGLMAVDPVNAQYYKENAEIYLARLGELNHWIIDTLKDLNDDQRQLVTSHDSLGYFAKRYGFKVIGTVIPSATTEAEDPSAADLARLIDQIKSTRVKAVFAENIHNKKTIETLSRDAGVQLAPGLYTDALGEPGTAGESYVKMMEHNVRIFAEYLK